MKGKLLEWKTWEDNLIRTNFKDIGRLRGLLPHRTDAQLQQRRRDICGKMHEQHRRWTAAKLKKLARVYTNGGLQAAIHEFPDRTPSALQRVCSYYGLKSPSRQLRPNPPDIPAVVGDIRNAVRDKPAGMVEVCKEIGLSAYNFKPGYLRGNTLNSVAVASLVAHLGGELYVEWED